MADDITAAREAWRSYVEELATLESRVLDSPQDGYFAAESLEHVARQVVNWTDWAAFHADPGRPAFHRQLDLATQWGGPNNDNVYRHARISPEHRYRIRGHMHGCEDFVLTLRAGFFHNEGYVTKKAITASEIGIRKGEPFEILLGGDEKGAIEIPDGVLNASVREYYFDWKAEEPALFMIECLDPPPPARLETAEMIDRLRASRRQIIDAIDFYHEYMEGKRSEQPDNTFPPTMKLAKGLSFGRYENVFWRLEPGEALIIDAAEPDARYWSAQTYLMHTFDLVDRFGRISSRNQCQTRISEDGRVRWVLSAEDPGVANWLDTGGRRVGLCVVRWFWPKNEQGIEQGMEPVARVVPIRSLRSRLPRDEPTIPPEARAAELAGRQEHLRFRFRT